jgi:hypothetical protein
VSYREKRQSAAPCRWPKCEEVGVSLALDHTGKPQWFCPDHHAHLKGSKP